MANRLLEESLGLRSVERTIEEVLIQAVSAQREGDLTTAEYEFGWRFADRLAVRPAAPGPARQPRARAS